MTVETISDVKNDILLSPRNLLTMKSKVILPPSWILLIIWDLLSIALEKNSTYCNLILVEMG